MRIIAVNFWQALIDEIVVGIVSETFVCAEESGLNYPVDQDCVLRDTQVTISVR